MISDTSICIFFYSSNDYSCYDHDLFVNYIKFIMNERLLYFVSKCQTCQDSSSFDSYNYLLILFYYLVKDFVCYNGLFLFEVRNISFWFFDRLLDDLLLILKLLVLLLLVNLFVYLYSFAINRLFYKSLLILD